jgi:hypothetical protein
VDAQTGIITTVAGTGRPGFGGDSGDATSALLKNPVHTTFDAAGNLYISDFGNFRCGGRLRSCKTEIFTPARVPVADGANPDTALLLLPPPLP